MHYVTYCPQSVIGTYTYHISFTLILNFTECNYFRTIVEDSPVKEMSNEGSVNKYWSHKAR